MLDRPPDKQKPRPSVTSTGDRATKQRHGLATRRYCTARDTALLLLAGAVMGLMFAHCVVEMCGQFGPPIDGLELLAMLSTGPARRKRPPYAKQLRLPPQDRKVYETRVLWVFVGSHAWDWAAKNEYCTGCKLVLPPGDHPAAYSWHCVAGFQDAVIVASGHPPPFDIIRALAGELLAHVGSVKYLDHKVDVHTFHARRKEAA